MSGLKYSAMAAVLTCIAAVSSANAADVEFVDTFKDWTVYTADQDGQKICYIASRPSKEEGNYSRRGDVATLVTHIPGGNAVNEVSIQSGYEYKAGVDVELKIDRKQFRMFTDGEHAWAKTVQDDNAIISAMRRGKQMVVVGRSSRNTLTTDSYSLLGFTAAFRRMVESCS